MFFYPLQKRQGQSKSKCISEKYIPEEDGGAGFPIEPTQSRALNVFSHSGQSMHPSAYGSSRNMNEEEALNSAELRKQRSCMHGSASQLSRFSNSVAVRGGSRFDISGDSSVNSRWPEDHFGARYSNLADGESNQLLGGHNSSHKKDNALLRKEPAMVKTY